MLSMLIAGMSVGDMMFTSGTTSSADTAKVDRWTVSHTMYPSSLFSSTITSPSVLNSPFSSSQYLHPALVLRHVEPATPVEILMRIGSVRLLTSLLVSEPAGLMSNDVVPPSILAELLPPPNRFFWFTALTMSSADSPSPATPAGRSNWGAVEGSWPGAGVTPSLPLGSDVFLDFICRLGVASAKGSSPSTSSPRPDLASLPMMLSVATAASDAASCASARRWRRRRCTPSAAVPLLSSTSLTWEVSFVFLSAASTRPPALVSRPSAATSSRPEDPVSSASASTFCCAVSRLSPTSSSSGFAVPSAKTTPNASISSLVTLTLLTASSRAVSTTLSCIAPVSIMRFSYAISA
mmetsp:Transcript_23514/g.80109  ORF Transcript_23514/g.80109 Transcript_23514/m.80109 type:complete len:351 (-) Transcript_23514:8537-9589(-)